MVFSKWRPFMLYLYDEKDVVIFEEGQNTLWNNLKHFQLMVDSGDQRAKY